MVLYICFLMLLAVVNLGIGIGFIKGKCEVVRQSLNAREESMKRMGYALIALAVLLLICAVVPFVLKDHATIALAVICILISLLLNGLLAIVNASRQ